MRRAGDDDMLVVDWADVARVGVYVCCGVWEVQPDEGRHGHHLGPGRGRGTARAGEGGERGQTRQTAVQEREAKGDRQAGWWHGREGRGG